MGCFLITCSGKVMAQGLVHLLWSRCPSPPHPAPFFGKCRVSGTDRVLEVLEVASTTCVIAGTCWKVLPSPGKRGPRVSGWNEQPFHSLYSLHGIDDIAKHTEFLGLKCNILVLILFNVIALIMLLLKNYMRPVSFTPATNGPLWLFESAPRRGSK